MIFTTTHLDIRFGSLRFHILANETSEHLTAGIPDTDPGTTAAVNISCLQIRYYLKLHREQNRRNSLASLAMEGRREMLVQHKQINANFPDVIFPV